VAAPFFCFLAAVPKTSQPSRQNTKSLKQRGKIDDGAQQLRVSRHTVCLGHNSNMEQGET